MKTYKQPVGLFLAAVLGFSLLAFLFAQINVIAKAAPANQLDVCATCTYMTIQTAVNAANPGDTIRVAQGTYQDTITATGLLTTTVLITKDLTLIGGYSPDFQTHDPATYETIIDGQNISKGFYVFGASAHIEGFTLINSLNQGVLVRTDFDTNPGSATIINNHIHDNPGTGIVFYQATGEVLSNTLAHNIWEGVAVAEAEATISGNTVTNHSLAGIWVSNSMVTIMGNEILSNTAEGGAGITLEASTQFTVTHNTIASNQAQLYGGGGIAIFDGATGSIAFNEITDNVSADCCGGGITAYANGDLIIANNTITANYSQSGGGGLDLNPDDSTFGTATFITITENSIQENIGSYGSGIALNNVNGGTYIASNDIRLNEMVANTPDFQSGGIHIWGSSGPTEIVNNLLVQNANRALKAANFSQIEVINNTMVSNGAMGIETFAWPVTPTFPYTTTVVNNIVAGHGECGVTGFNGAVMYVDYNLFHDNDTDICLTTAVPPYANIFADPEFVNPAVGNYRLQSISPAIDNGTAGPTIPSADIEGTARPQGSGFDMGAYETVQYQIYLPLMMKPPPAAEVTVCTGNTAVALLVDPQLTDSIRSGLDQFETDLCAEGYTVIERVSNFSTPPEARAYLADLHTRSNGQLEGALIIGNFPRAYQWIRMVFANPDIPPLEEEVISFQYYSDLDGTFAMSPDYVSPGNHDYSFDIHTGETDWEIWTGVLPFYNDSLTETITVLRKFS